jgi:alkylhydroperoxidase family enzyme
MMRTRTIAVLAATLAVAGVRGQSALSPDIHPQSLSRLPPIVRAELDGDGQRVWDYIAGPSGAMPKVGPQPVTMYSPKAAEPIQTLNQYLRNSIVGKRHFELSALVAAREFDQQYEWTGHETAALRVGVEQSVIDVIKYNRDPAALSEKDATVIRLGRALFREHQLTPDLWAKTVALFGRQGAVEVTTIMADYAMVGFILTAVDQQLPPERKPLLPPR